MDTGRRGRLLVVGLIALGLGLGGFASWYRVAHRVRTDAPRAASRPVPGERDRIVVEVLNASGATGLARTATGRLRDAGVDVVYYGSDTASALDSTEVLVRRGSAAAGERVREVLGAGRVRAAPDAARLVDVTVRLGRDLATLLRDP
jgi:hypothetical protein